MVAVLYLIVCTGFGISLIHVMIPDIRRFFSEIAASSNPEFFPELVFTIPAGFLVGTLSTSMFSYYLTYILARCTGHSDGIRALGMEITVLVFVLWMVVNVIRIKKRGLPIEKYQSNVSNNRFYGISIGVFLLLASFLMIDSYRLSGNSLQAGYAAMSDLAPYGTDVVFCTRIQFSDTVSAFCSRRYPVPFFLLLFLRHAGISRHAD